MIKDELLIWLRIANEVIYWALDVENEYFVEKYSILTLETKTAIYQFRLNATREYFPSVYFVCVI